MTCPVSNQIAKHCDEPEQESAWELYKLLSKNGFVNINGNLYRFTEIHDMLDSDKYKAATGDEFTKMYIDKIAELMGD